MYQLVLCFFCLSVVLLRHFALGQHLLFFFGSFVDAAFSFCAVPGISAVFAMVSISPRRFTDISMPFGGGEGGWKLATNVLAQLSRLGPRCAVLTAAGATGGAGAAGAAGGAEAGAACVAGGAGLSSSVIESTVCLDRFRTGLTSSTTWRQLGQLHRWLTMQQSLSGIGW